MRSVKVERAGIAGRRLELVTILEIGPISMPSIVRKRISGHLSF